MANTCPQVQVPNDVGQVEILTCLRTLAIVPRDVCTNNTDIL